MSRIVDVRHAAERTTIVLRSYRLWEALTVPLALPAGALVYEFATRAHPPVLQSAQERALDTLFALGVSLGVAAIAAIAAYLLGGREEIVTASHRALVIDRQVLRTPEWRVVRHYEGASVQRGRAYLPSAAERAIQRRPGAKPAPWQPSLAFDHERTVVRFGVGLRGADADRVVDLVTAAMR